jgi:hypothetical protein
LEEAEKFDKTWSKEVGRQQSQIEMLHKCPIFIMEQKEKQQQISHIGPVSWDLWIKSHKTHALPMA